MYENRSASFPALGSRPLCPFLDAWVSVLRRSAVGTHRREPGSRIKTALIPNPD